MNRFISKVLKLEGYLEGNLLKRYPTGVAPATKKFKFPGPHVPLVDRPGGVWDASSAVSRCFVLI